MDQPNPHRTRPIIIDALRQAASTFASHRAMVLILRSVKYLLAGLLILCLADALLHFTSGSRLGLLAAIGAIVLGLGITALVLALAARPSLEKMADLLEHRNHELGSKLTNVLQLDAQSRDDALDPLTRDLARRAVEESAHRVDPAALPPIARYPRLQREFKWAILPVTIFLLLAGLLGEPAHRQLLRYFDPYGDHPPLSFTWLDISKPAEDGIEILFGESTRIEVSAKGHRPKELILTAQPRDGSTPPRTLPMTTRGDGSYVVLLENIREPLELTATTPNARTRSKHRQLSVLFTPQIEEAWLQVSPPAYTGLPTIEKPFRFAGVQALEGSELRFRLRSNRPLGMGTLTAILPEGKSLTFALQPSPEGPAQEALATCTPTESGRLIFQVRDVDAREADHNPTSSLTITRDLPPTITFLAPVEDSYVVEDFAFTMQITASDDYGLRSIRLFAAIDGRQNDPLEWTFEGVGPRRHLITKDINLLEMNAQPGEVISFYAETVDNCPTPHLTRTEVRRLEVISETDYNDFLRKSTDVAQIAGKYEALLGRFNNSVDQQRELTKQLEGLTMKAANGELTEAEKTDLTRLAEQQETLNKELGAVADEMKNFGRDNPVYDFEKDLREQLRQMAKRIEESVAQNQEDLHQAGAATEAPTPKPRPEENEAETEAQTEGEGKNSPKQGGEPDPEAIEQAARDHLERLAGEELRGEEAIRQPLEDLAGLHELLKDFSQFKALYHRQTQLTEHTERFNGVEQVTAADKMSLEDLAARQREVGRALEDLEEKLRRHADLAELEFPKAAASARDLADAMELADMPGLARNSSRSMLQGEGHKSHSRASLLQNEMSKLFEQAEQGQGAGQGGLDAYLSLTRGMNPGNSFQQMMQSLNFNPGQQGQGGSGGGQMGSMATEGSEGRPTGLLGGESLLNGPIARSMAGGPGPNNKFGAPGGPLAKIDREAKGRTNNSSTRQTNTPESQALFQEYEPLTDAYFRSLTNPKPSNK